MRSRFGGLEEALRFIGAFEDRASLALRCPDGAWHRFSNDRAIVVNRRRASRAPLRRTLNVRPAVDSMGRASMGRAFAARTLDTSASGLRMRVSGNEQDAPVGTTVICSPVSANTGREVRATVVWARGDQRGLHVDATDVASRAALSAWSDDGAVACAAPARVEVVEVCA